MLMMHSILHTNLSLLILFTRCIQFELINLGCNQLGSLVRIGHLLPLALFVHCSIIELLLLLLLIIATSVMMMVMGMVVVRVLTYTTITLMTARRV